MRGWIRLLAKGTPEAQGAEQGGAAVEGRRQDIALSDFEPFKEPLVLEESEKTAGSIDEFGPGFFAGKEIA
jgi:hypothetical protein